MALVCTDKIFQTKSTDREYKQFVAEILLCMFHGEENLVDSSEESTRTTLHSTAGELTIC